MDRQELMNELSGLWKRARVISAGSAPWRFEIEVPGEDKRILIINEKWASTAEVADVLRLAEPLPPGEHLITKEGRVHTV
jgi:hypothetical protein